MAALIEKPEGWFVDVMPITPQRLLGGERRPAIVGGAVSALFVFQLAPKATGSLFGVPTVFVFGAAGVAFFVLWMALLAFAWRVDPWLSKTLLRFLSFPHFIPAHSSAASDAKRRALRKKAHLKR